jgi:hypothetical protein
MLVCASSCGEKVYGGKKSTAARKKVSVASHVFMTTSVYCAAVMPDGFFSNQKSKFG